MGKHIRHIRKQSPGAAAWHAAGLLGVSLLCLPLASAAGRFGLDAQDGVVEIAAVGVGMQDVTPIALRDVRVSGLPQLHDDDATLRKINLSPFLILAQAKPPAIVVEQPNWLSRSVKDPSLLREIINSINNGQTANLETTSYSAVGPMGMPTLRVPLTLDFFPGDTKENNRQYLELARTACVFLDARVRQAGAWGAECKIERVVKWPKGALTEDKDNTYRPGSFWFDPVGIGQDEFRFVLTNGAGKTVDVTFVFNVKRGQKELGQSDSIGGEVTALSGSVDSWLASARLSAVLAGAVADLSGFADLSGAAVGTTEGNGASAQITLDTTSAGHGWYIDPTPLDNTDDYLPTSNPNVWQAKAGSDAAGKMDLLSARDRQGRQTGSGLAR